MKKIEALAKLAQLIDDGWLIGVQVFGAEDGFGLCDVFSKNSPGGSDCNRAERFLLRPAGPLMTDDIAALIVDESTTKPFSELKDWIEE